MAYRHVQWGWTWLLYLIFSVVMNVVILAGMGESGDEEAWVIVLTVGVPGGVVPRCVALQPP